MKLSDQRRKLIRRIIAIPLIILFLSPLYFYKELKPVNLLLSIGSTLIVASMIYAPIYSHLRTEKEILDDEDRDSENPYYTIY